MKKALIILSILFLASNANTQCVLCDCISDVAVTIAGPNELCTGESIILTASPTGCFDPLTSSWTNNELTVTTAGTYTVTVTDNAGCTATASQVVIENPNPAIAASFIDPDCGTCNGSIDISVTLGTAPYTYTWSNGASTEDLTDLCVGMYTVTVTDDNGCSNTSTFDLNEPNGPVLGTMAGVFSFCDGAGPESISNTITGGTAPYTWNWSAPATSTNASSTTWNAAPGTYIITVTVTDDNNCSDVATQTVTVHPLPTANAGADVTICSGETTTLTASGGGTYVWSNGPTTASNPVSPTTNTTYTVTVTDTNGCTDTDQVTVTVNDLPTAFAGNNITVCSGQSGSFSGSASGGSGGYTYSWSPGLHLSSTTVASPTVTVGTNATTGVFTYILTVTDSNGCSSTDEVTLTIPSGSVSIAGPANLCASEITTYTATIIPGTAPYDYTISSGGSGSTTSTTISWSYTAPPSAGTFSVSITITDGNNCTYEATQSIVVDPQPTATLNNTVLYDCPPSSCDFNTTGNVNFYNLNSFVTGTTGGTWYAENVQSDCPNAPNSNNILPVGAVTSYPPDYGLQELTYVVQGTGGCSDVYACEVLSVMGMVLLDDSDLEITVTGDPCDCASNPTITVDLEYIGPDAANCWTAFNDQDGQDGTVNIYTWDDANISGTSVTNGGQTLEIPCSNIPAGGLTTIELIVQNENTIYGSGFCTDETLDVDIDTQNCCGCTVTAQYNGNCELEAIPNNCGNITGVAWDGPFGFSDTQNPTIIEYDGNYEVTITDDNGCTAVADIDIDDIDIVTADLNTDDDLEFTCIGAGGGSPLSRIRHLFDLDILCECCEVVSIDVERNWSLTNIDNNTSTSFTDNSSYNSCADIASNIFTNLCNSNLSIAVGDELEAVYELTITSIDYNDCDDQVNQTFWSHTATTIVTQAMIDCCN